MKIATLGPEGTFSHEAAMKYGRNASIIFTDTIRDVFEAVSKNKADCGIAPIENSIAGTVGQTLDCLVEFGLKIKAEEILPISHNLVGFGNINGIKRLYSHPQAYEQCELFIKKYLPKAETIQTSSNGKSAEIISKSKNKNEASIIPKIAVGIYGLKVLKKDVQDNRFNVTRFFVIAKNDSKKTGYDRTSIALYPQVDRPGLLYEMLGEFAKRKINLTKIESRPSKGKLGDYIFYIDFEGHKSEKHIGEALNQLEKSAFVTVLGSYRRKY
ncbi:prephenate dehydratase [Candidatus Woesearchaeota archaeon]|nr:prephenate dehydratase [Candidatus Woesearchaeota archaeon]